MPPIQLPGFPVEQDEGPEEAGRRETAPGNASPSAARDDAALAAPRSFEPGPLDVLADVHRGSSYTLLGGAQACCKTNALLLGKQSAEQPDLPHSPLHTRVPKLRAASGPARKAPRPSSERWAKRMHCHISVGREVCGLVS